jgi:hypothetical protein
MTLKCPEEVEFEVLAELVETPELELVEDTPPFPTPEMKIAPPAPTTITITMTATSS